MYCTFIYELIYEILELLLVVIELKIKITGELFWWTLKKFGGDSPGGIFGTPFFI